MTQHVPDNHRTDKRMPALLSLKQAADVLGVVRQYAHRMAESKELPGQKVGGTWVFRTSVVLQVRDARPKKKTPPASDGA